MEPVYDENGGMEQPLCNNFAFQSAVVVHAEEAHSSETETAGTTRRGTQNDSST